MGILAETLLNFLGMLAYSFPEDREKFSLDEMVSSFDVSRINLSGPIFDQEKLTWLNQQYLMAMDEEEMLARLKAWKFNDDFLKKLMPMMMKRMHKLGDFFSVCDFMFYSEVSYEPETMIPGGKEQEDTRDALQKLVWELEKVTDFEKDAIYAAFQRIGKIHGWNLRALTHAARIAVCGKSVAPPMFDAMAIIGSDVCRNRLMAGVEKLGPLGKKKLSKLQKLYRHQLESLKD
jgi:glutamyl-tRNA synthetase